MQERQEMQERQSEKRGVGKAGMQKRQGEEAKVRKGGVQGKAGERRCKGTDRKPPPRPDPISAPPRLLPCS